MLSIVIPTLNEEDYLAKLLESIKNQEFNDYEIIIADAGSKDKTLNIAKKFGCRVIKGGSPAKGRNAGAKVAKGSLFLFLDADVVLKNKTLAKALKEFKKKKLKIATFFLLPSGKKKTPKFLFTFFYNLPIFLLEKILPHAAMGILVERKLFFKLGGFDEKVFLAEDHDLARRAKKLGRLAKYGIIKSAPIYVSDRRFREDGWLKTGFKYLFCEGHMILVGPVKKDLFKYKYTHLKNVDKK